jgi:hypothetical protein
MSSRRATWTEQGKIAAARNGVSKPEAEQAFHAPAGLRHEVVAGDLVVVMGMAHTGRVIAVLCNRVAGNQWFEIVSARPLTRDELATWTGEVL